jgi:hypothetical protein
LDVLDDAKNARFCVRQNKENASVAEQDTITEFFSGYDGNFSKICNGTKVLLKN